jgi:hypothetical protein
MTSAATLEAPKRLCREESMRNVSGMPWTSAGSA